MSDHKAGPGLRVDRLAAAMDAARQRQQGGTSGSPASQPQKPDVSLPVDPPPKVPSPPGFPDLSHVRDDLARRTDRLVLTNPEAPATQVASVESEEPPAAGTQEPDAPEATGPRQEDPVRIPVAPAAAVSSETEAAPKNQTDVHDRAVQSARISPPDLLTVRGLRTDIGGYQILQGVDLTVPEGQVTMLLGRNGVGKTTTLRSLMGLWRPKAGSVRMGGQELSQLSPPQIARAGVAYVPEDMGIFSDLTVAENMTLAALKGTVRKDRLEWILTTFPALKTFWKSPAGQLSGGQKQMLSIARAMVEERRLYLIDEPTKGLAPSVVKTLAGALRDLKSQGASILLVEQNFAVAKSLGDTCVVMDDGKTVWNGLMSELSDNPALQQQLMGLSLDAEQQS